MKKSILLFAALWIAFYGFGQTHTAAGTFECNLGTSTGYTVNQIQSAMVKGNFENYRLQTQRTKLTFDNGFEVTLYAATEAQQMGLLSNAADYPKEFAAGYQMPVFHMEPNGMIGAGYKAFDKKYSTMR